MTEIPSRATLVDNDPPPSASIHHRRRRWPGDLSRISTTGAVAEMSHTLLKTFIISHVWAGNQLGGMATEEKVYRGTELRRTLILPLNRVTCAPTLDEISLTAQNVKMLAPKRERYATFPPTAVALPFWLLQTVLPNRGGPSSP
jgi:hypothetical protein